MVVEDIYDIQYRFFFVNDQPFCIWDPDIEKITLEFLDSVSPDYFSYISDAHITSAIEDKSQHAALAIRATYSQGLEALFALIAASIQAARCVPAWIVQYRNPDLYEVIRRINSGVTLPTQLREKYLSWQRVADFIYSWLKLEDSEEEAIIKQGFAALWSRFAYDFLDKGHLAEFNSIKHGFRIRPGGFNISFGVQDEPGVPAPKVRMKLMGQSDFGSSYFLPEKLADTNHHIRLRRHHRNWNPEDYGWGLHMISMSISNVISALKCLNNFPAEDVQFQWPTDLNALKEPWKRTIQMGVTSMTGFQETIPDELIDPFSKEEITEKYHQGNDAGIRRFRFPDQDE